MEVGIWVTCTPAQVPHADGPTADLACLRSCCTVLSAGCDANLFSILLRVHICR
jgi:hypothetical protein